MKNFLEKTLRQNVMIEETEYLNEKLPLAFRGRYTFYKVETNGSPWIAIQPKADVGLAALRKDWIKIEKAAGLNCAIFFDSTSFYIKEKLLEEGIPFVLKDKQVYLPFIGYLLSNENERKISPVHLISFLTQKVILVAIYEKWENVTASKAAIRLGVTKMSANRCFESSPNLCVHSSSSYVSPSMLPLSSGDLIEWSLVCHSTLSYQKFCDRHSNHYDHPEELHQSVE